ncbi:MAG: DNA polymerase IV, partial [Stackebrandtia sp.]
GVNSAMPMAVARRRCPQAAFLHPDGREYSRVSKAVMAIFAEYTPLVEALSVDEAFLDVSGARALFGPPAAVAAAIRRRVADAHGITCTVGIAPNKFVAKLASTQAKPDGLAVVPADKVLDFLHPLPISVLWGVGDKTAAVLGRLGMRTVADVARAGRRRLEASVGKASAAHLDALANGRDARAVESTRVDKSIGAEVTFDADVDDREELLRTTLRLSQKVAARARKAGVAGRTVSVKIRYADFATVTRAKTLLEPIDVAQELYTVAAELIKANVSGPVRLIGVRLEGLGAAGDGAWQPTLGAPERGWREIERTVDGLSARYGSSVVRPASLLDPNGQASRHAAGVPQSGETSE